MDSSNSKEDGFFEFKRGWILRIQKRMDSSNSKEDGFFEFKR
jgi:hypothetical protein